MNAVPETPSQDVSLDQPSWEYLTKLALTFAVVLTIGAIVVLADSYAALLYLATP